MVPRNRARYLAPIALVAVIAGAYLVVHTVLTAKPSKSHAHAVTRLTRSQRRYAKAIFYTVQPGDSLTSIASKTGIPLGILETLNPNVDPNALQTAQRLRLRR
jgi:hypothetical protein